MVSIADFVQAPTPYIIGLLKTENQSDIFSQLSEDDQVIICFYENFAFISYTFKITLILLL